MLRPFKIDGRRRPPDDAVLILREVGTPIAPGCRKEFHMGIPEAVPCWKLDCILKGNLDQMTRPVIALRLRIHPVEKIEGILLFENEGVVRLLTGERGCHKTGRIIIFEKLLSGARNSFIGRRARRSDGINQIVVVGVFWIENNIEQERFRLNETGGVDEKTIAGRSVRKNGNHYKIVTVPFSPS